MKTILRRPGLVSLLFAQSQVAFNDNATKLALIGITQMLMPMAEAQRFIGLISLLLVAPFVLFAPLTGWASDRFAKHDVFAASLWLQLAVMVLLLLAASGGSLAVALIGFFLLGLQSAIMSPARQGMVKELAGENVGEAVGWMEMLCMAAILAGSLAGGQLIDFLAPMLGAWDSGFVILALLTVSCIVAQHAFHRVPRQPAATSQPFNPSLLFGHVALIRLLLKDRAIWRAALGSSAFSLVGGTLMLTLTEVGRGLHPDGHGAARTAGILLFLLGMGIAAGSVFAAQLSRRQLAMGLVPFGAFGVAGALAMLAVVKAGGLLFAAGLFAMGIFGGLYIVPLGAFLVNRAPEATRGRILAASSMASSLAGIAAVGLYVLMTQIFHAEVRTQLFILSAEMVIAACVALTLLPQHALRILVFFLARFRYSVRQSGTENIPAQGGALIVCNHVSYVDTIILSMGSPRPIRFLSYAPFFEIPVLGAIMRLFGAIPVSPTRAKEALSKTAECIRQGELVCIFPEGQLTRTGCLMELKSGFEVIARRSDCPVIVAHLDGLWGSIFSFERGRYFFKWPQARRRRLTVSYATPLSPSQAKTESVRETLLELGEAAFRKRAFRTANLATAFLQSLKSSPLRTVITDPAGWKKPLRANSALTSARLLAKVWQASLPAHRVGVILSPGIPGALANMALILAGKIPVNLNPLIARDAAADCIARSNITDVITSAPLADKYPDFPWPQNIVWMEKELAQFPNWQLALGLAMTFLIPSRLWMTHLPGCRAQRDEEAFLLFTSGSSGLPKGVPLTHANLLGNLTQVVETSFLTREDRLLSPLPLFHSFGLTMGFLFPIIEGRTLIAAPSPLDCEKITEAARGDAPTVLLATPTFLRMYLRRIPRDAFSTLRLIFTGAEKLPAQIASASRDRFGCEILEGYGLTECSPVVAFNLPHPARGLGADSLQAGSKPGSVGRLLPGISAHMIDSRENIHHPGTSRGILALRGVNIVERYLSCPSHLSAGYLLTGDLVRCDLEGFLFVEGRTSRFSKIGGEMVSHTAVEEAIASAIPSEQKEECVVGQPSAEKGEELVLITTRALTREILREALSKHGLPNLWIPRTIIHIQNLPMLGSGKLDLAACQRLVDTTGACV